MKSSPHRHTPAIISLTAIQNNVKKIRDYIQSQGKSPQLFAVVKANAYGHGAIEVAQSVHDLVDGFCVSNLDEAIELRQSLITKPILVLSGIVPESKLSPCRNHRRRQCFYRRSGRNFTTVSGYHIDTKSPERRICRGK